MWHYIKEGWTIAWKQPFSVVALFVYQMFWGIMLYRMVQSVVLPILHRFPDPKQSSMAAKLFIAEGQFQLFKTDISHSYIAWLLLLLGIRMLVHPLLNAGIYYSLSHTQLNAGYRFVQGIRELMLPFLIYYVSQIVLLLLPLYILLPKFSSIVMHNTDLWAISIKLLPWLLGYLAYGGILRLGFTYIQFGRANQSGFLLSLLVFIRHSLSASLIALILLLITGLLSVLALAATYLWAGMVALLIYQLFPLARIFIKMWSLSSQYHLWNAKQQVL